MQTMRFTIAPPVSRAGTREKLKLPNVYGFAVSAAQPSPSGVSSTRPGSTKSLPAFLKTAAMSARQSASLINSVPMN
ncbi:Uu.00g081050.m01.CDS01 [Anthostomella pinea]|uniref:Uu.00g081050.m01.CDS01 n=1 Tax=Anthostomella pinea TaxID=933095 RepID=A0AAI8VL54_9PEZI|nr:Uu.00g081050.m01.CDS01 [Anthostomella pinea]